MTEREVTKLEVAREYLDAAIDFFLAGRNLFCAIHLSAAAEELLGAHLLVDQPTFALACKAEREFKSEAGSIASDAAARKSVNEWKNEVKHLDGGTNKTLKIDPAFAAQHHIERALINFYKLGLQKSPAVWKFEDYQNRRVSAGWANDSPEGLYPHARY